MKKETLIKARNIVADLIKETELETIEKLELMINLDKFLENYDENIKVLSKKKHWIGAK